MLASSGSGGGLVPAVPVEAPTITKITSSACGEPTSGVSHGLGPSTITGLLPGQGRDRQQGCCPAPDTSDNTQIYEGANQIQRMVIARQLLKGVT
jgi:hypothetical protein